jgi:hypothetical protein
MLGYLQLLMGDPTSAGALFDISLAGARDLGIGRDEPFPLVGLALVAMTRGDLGRSLALMSEAVETARSCGATKSEIAARLGRVVLCQELGAPERATADLDAVDALAPAVAPYLLSIRLAARGWLHVAGGKRQNATAQFAHARSASDGLLLSRIATGRIEILAWSAARDEAAMSDAAAWLLDGVAGRCPAAETLAGWALARTRRDGATAASSLQLARRAGDRTLLWRACFLGSVEARKLGNTELATSLREEARRIVGSVADSLPDEELRARFQTGSEVADLLRGDGTRF